MLVKEAFVRAYAEMVHPMASQDMWPKCNLAPLLLSKYHNQPRKPRKKGIKSAAEPLPTYNPNATKLPMYDMEIKRSICNQAGHNMRRCLKAKEGQFGSQVFPTSGLCQCLFQIIKNSQKNTMS
ncbi:hypothetical protein L3X38_004047 [Prunus dulcis]|uniref:Uncharacterized protein n=1 Tax=Prunus dulcis TaxID=3755 RepID=A0AAD4ZN99_PRUDU|nr:hypothetical protein L3X38_004047 [Prunus dulcis]